MSVFSVIIGNNKSIPHHPAVISSNETYTYKQLEDKINQAALFLQSLGIGKNSKTAILSSNNSDYVILILALWQLDACVIPLNIRLTDIELTEVLKFSDSDFLLYNELEKRNLPINIPAIKFPLNIDKPYTNGSFNQFNSSHISLIMFTSGATGKPKGVMHSLNDLINSADNSQSLLKQTENDKWLASLPFYHIGGFSIIIRALHFGSTLIIPGSLATDDIRKAFDNVKPTLASLVGTQLKRLLEDGWRPGNELKNLLLGGGFVDEELLKNALSAGCNISNVYGSTETSAFVTANSNKNVYLKPLSSGKPLGNNKLYIVDKELKKLPSYTEGEIVIESNALFHGYFKEEVVTKQKFFENKFFTGDIGYTDSEGDLFVISRRTDLIITGGENVNPLEVENILNSIPQITESCVFAMEDKDWGHIVAAAIVMKAKISIDDINSFVKGRLAGYKIPARYFQVEKIPRTSLGKIIREKIRDEINL
jgi:o-succinylbenzoate---CoA ligase